MQYITPPDFEIESHEGPSNSYAIKYSDSDIRNVGELNLRDLLRGYDFTKPQCDYVEAYFMHVEEEFVVVQVVTMNGIVLPIDERHFVYLDSFSVCEFFFKHYSEDFCYWPLNKEDAFKRWTDLYSEESLRKLAGLNFETFKRFSAIQGIENWMIQYFGLRRGNYDLILDCDIEVRTKTNALNILIWMCWKRCQEIYC